MSDVSKLSQAVISGNFELAKELSQELINSGTEPLTIIDGLIAGMNVVGEKFKVGLMFVPEVMMAAKAMAEGIDLVKPLIDEGDIPSKGTVVIATVKGDLHDIGKNLVAMILESSGFKVVDLGIDVTPTAFLEAVKKHKPQVVAMSALLTTTMMVMKDTIELLKEEGLRDDVKIIIGGAPVSQEFADQIMADGYGADALEAKELCMQLVD